MLSALIALSIVGVAAPANALLSITVPGSKNLGSTSVASSTQSAQLGTVTGTTTIGLAFVATVTATNFTTGGGSANETISKSQIYYWSGSSTGTTGVLLTNVPGQANAGLAVPLTVGVTAYSASGALAFSVSWNPTIVVHIPANAVAGTYTGTITHSIA